MKRIFTYIIALSLFVACAFNEDIVPENMTEGVLGFVSRNIEKDRSELFADMKEITKQGMIFFEVYNEGGELVAVLDEPSDFETSAVALLEKSKYSIKSISKIQINLSVDLPLDL